MTHRIFDPARKAPGTVRLTLDLPDIAVSNAGTLVRFILRTKDLRYNVASTLGRAFVGSLREIEICGNQTLERIYLIDQREIGQYI